MTLVRTGRLAAACLLGGSLLLPMSASVAQTTSAASAAQAPPATGRHKLDLSRVVDEQFSGDFDQMLARRRIRFLAPYSRTLFYGDKGQERGITAELARDFEQFVNRKYAKQLGKRPLTVYLIASTRDELLPDLAEGRGDIAAGNLTVTPAREKLVDFVAPSDMKGNSEIVVTGPTSPALASMDDLAGRTVHVRPSSSYHDSVVRLNERLKQAGKPAVQIVALPDALEDEDILEMVNAGVLPLAIVDDWKAKIWAQILPSVKLREDLALASDQRIGWAIRKGSPQLRAVLEEFYFSYVKKQGIHTQRMAQAARRVKQIRNNTADAERKRFLDTLALFQLYGPKYGFDPIMLAAQGYQESRLRQDAKSHVGAIGIMQVMPATGKELKVGDITVAEANVHAGAKYMDQLMRTYFKDANFSDADRPLFAFASYNAGPGRVSSLRKEAGRRGLNPDKWFNNVEIVAADKVGIETTTYVRNIYKYYVSYTLLLETEQERRRALESLGAKPAAPSGAAPKKAP